MITELSSGLLNIRSKLTKTSGATSIMAFTSEGQTSTVRVQNTGAVNSVYFDVVAKGASAPTVSASDHLFVAGPGEGLWLPYDISKVDIYDYSPGTTLSARGMAF